MAATPCRSMSRLGWPTLGFLRWSQHPIDEVLMAQFSVRMNTEVLQRFWAAT